MDSNIRTGQLLTPFGIGQIVTFPDEVSVMISGLDLWDKFLDQKRISDGIDSISVDQLKIPEDRLTKLLNVDYFLSPFPYTEKGYTNNRLKIPAARFPGWHHCVNPHCGIMKEEKLAQSDKRIECQKCGSKMISVRFVAVCQHGHIQDVPFKEWVHNDAIPNDGQSHTLRYKANSGSGDLGSVFISCDDCDKSRSLAGIMNVFKDEEEDYIYDSALSRIGLEKDNDLAFSASNPNTKEINPSGRFCEGQKPWLGLDGVNNPDKCGNHLRVLIRGGSNIHYSNIQSAIYLPKTKDDINQYAQKVIDEFNGGINKLQMLFELDEDGVNLKSVLSIQDVVQDELIAVDELFKEIVAQFEEEAESEIYNDKDIRWEEYQYILKGRNSENSDFKAIVKNFNDYNEADYLKDFFSRIVLIEKLKETRVFTGFSRITPNRGSLEERKKLLSNKPVKWLPAYQVHGEGIFLEFNSEKLEDWIKKTEGYFNMLIMRYHSAMRNRKPDYEEIEINPVFVMIHTFAHLLIKRLCYNCGYGSSSLREKIYFSSDAEQKMNGVLIYTSSGDSEGSLGGLVRQGKEEHLAKLIRDSIADAEWCSADPVCSEVGQSSGQGPDSVNGSACHNCCLVPETSCEEFNSILDRATVVGTLENSELGYFDLSE